MYSRVRAYVYKYFHNHLSFSLAYLSDGIFVSLLKIVCVYPRGVKDGGYTSFVKKKKKTLNLRSIRVYDIYLRICISTQ